MFNYSCKRENHHGDSCPIQGPINNQINDIFKNIQVYIQINKLKNHIDIKIKIKKRKNARKKKKKIMPTRTVAAINMKTRFI